MEYIQKEIQKTLQNYIIPFWLSNSLDKEYGGYITSFDENGKFDGNGVKNIVTQSRMVWGFSNLITQAKPEQIPAMKEAAAHGAKYLMNQFWDEEYGGWFWLLNRDGSIKDPSKLTYGEGFAIYALSEYYLMSKDLNALKYAQQGFNLLQKYAADTLNGGYFENIEQNWTLSPSGIYAGDRKSLDIHMHLLEAFTTLYKASGEPIHKRKLKEIYDLILRHMVNQKEGYCFNQFDIEFNKIPAINIARTWNNEREKGETLSQPTDTTSYGHNVELTWLGDEALQVIDARTDKDLALFEKILNHTLEYGYDKKFGGIYRDGIGTQPAIIKDKEWWQNFEAMTAFLNGWIFSKKEDYRRIFTELWEFNKTYFINYEIGESRQLLKQDGTPLISNIGNPWKGIYHTGRALAECLKRLQIKEGK